MRAERVDGCLRAVERAARDLAEVYDGVVELGAEGAGAGELERLLFDSFRQAFAAQRVLREWARRARV